MLTVLLAVWLFVVGIQLVFILLVFSRTAFYQSPVAQQSDASDASAPGVTVVVCAHNEHDNLLELLPLLTAQTYPHYEVLVMDDRSTDLSNVLLDEMVTLLPILRYIRIDTEADHVTAKKYALTIALKKARFPIVLLTDADCRPASDQWLVTMVAAYADEQNELVLGFSPYEYRPGLLNLLIRSETLFTAVQYFSLALAGWPYMGVGRNLSYRTRLFFANKGFYNHINVVGGDDDLFVNETATRRNTAVCLETTAFTWSKPKETWAEWRHQKKRHLNVGRFYKSPDKFRLGLLIGSYVLSWALALVAGVVVLLHLTVPFSFTHSEWLLLLTGTAAFAVRLLTFWGIVGRISYRLAHTVPWGIMPVVDLLLAMYYGLNGLWMLVTRRQKHMQWR